MAYNKTQEVFFPQKRYEHSKVNINMRIICIRNLKDSLELIQSTPEKEVSLSMIGKRVVVILLVILFFLVFVIVCLLLSNPEGSV